MVSKLRFVVLHRGPTVLGEHLCLSSYHWQPPRQSLLWQPLRVSMCVSLVFWVNSTRNTCVHCLAIAAYPFHQRPIPTGVAIHRPILWRPLRCHSLLPVNYPALVQTCLAQFETKHPSQHPRLAVSLCFMASNNPPSESHFHICYERSEELGLFVYDEEDNENILLHRISSDDIYRKQEDTIISWRDPEYATELALSFQEPSGCSYIWDNICNVQRNMHFNTLNSEPFHSVSSEPRELPAVELSTLPLILKTVVDSGFADQLRLTELILSDQAFFRKLMEVFRMCEDLENIDGLHMIFKIVKGIVLLNSSAIFERIFSDDFIVDIIGALEYDPEVPFVQHHRKFLKEHVVFKEAIPIKDPVVLSKIHQTYRVGFLKDVVLARVLDEGIGANLNSIIHSNNAYVVSLLKDDSTFIQELFARLKSPTTSQESKKNLVSLDEDIVLFASLCLYLERKAIPPYGPHHPPPYILDLMNEGIFDVVTNVLQSQDKKLVLTGTDILILFLNQDPNLLRSYFVRQEGFALLGLLVKGMLTDFGENMHCQFLEILRNLLDSCTLSGPQRDTIIDIFFERHLGQLIEVITASCPSENTADASGKSIGPGRRIQCQIGTKPEILSNICELLCFCVLHHPYRIKCNFLLNNVIEKILLLIRRAERYLVVGAVRFIRTILSRHDEHLINYFVRNNVLKPIIDAFVSNGNRYNLFHSAVLELFEFIQKCLDNGGTKDATAVEDIRRRNDERALEREEERYFNEDSDEEDSASASVPRNQKGHQQPNLSNGVAASYSQLSPRSLVDYEDDEDDEDYKPPPREQPETSEEDDGIMESLRLKRKLPSKDKEPELEKKQKLSKNSKSKDSVFAALCSTLSQAVLPSKKTSIDIHTCARTDGRMSSSEDNQGDVQNISRSSSSNNSNIAAEDNHVEKEGEASRSFSDCLHAKSDNIQLGGEERPLVAPKSSPEMAVNGS
ncbi:Serine/threonine-protein phosphatase 4 regulatory subunit 3 [Glycine soja]